LQESPINLDSCTGLGNIYEDDLSIGLEPTSMKDNETVLEFKKRTFKELQKLNLDIKFEDLRWVTDGGYEE